MATLCTLAGLAIEISCNGLITIFCRHFQRVSSFYGINNVIMILFNVTSVIYSCFCIWSLVLGEQGCSLISMTDTALGHLFYIFFDAFMLYKTYQISHKNFYILFINVILMANRIIWSVLDTTHSSAAYDTTEQLCVFNQNEWTGIGYNAADTIIDSYATIVAVAASWHKFNSWRNTYRAMVEKNILRSVIVISMDAFLVWANANWTTQYLSWLCWFLQNYTLARALNWDLFWFPESVTLCTCVKKGSPESQLSVSEGSFGQGDRNTAAGSDIKNSVTSQEGQQYARKESNSGFGTNTILPLRTVQVVQPLQRSPSKRGMS